MRTPRKSLIVQRCASAKPLGALSVCNRRGSRARGTSEADALKQSRGDVSAKSDLGLSRECRVEEQERAIMTNAD